MTKQVLTNAGLWLGEHAIASSFNSIQIEGDTNLHDVTGFGAGAKESAPGFKGIRLSAAGFYEDVTEEAFFDKWALPGVPVSVAADAIEGGIAYLGQFVLGEFRSNRSVGAPGEFSFGGQPSTDSFARGHMLAVRQGVSASGQAGAVARDFLSAGRLTRAALHVISCTGSLSVTIEAGDNASMDNPVDVVTFSAATGATSIFETAAEFIAKTHWRAKWTMSGGTAAFAVSAGSN